MTTPEDSFDAGAIDENVAEEFAAEELAAPQGAEQSAVPAPAPVNPTPQTVGRRKRAIARVRMVPGSGKFTLNGKTLDDYFPNKLHQQVVRDPFATTERNEQYDIVATLSGGGPSGQAGALRMAIARALTESDPEDRPALKKAGFLTRDARMKERKKYGLKKARKSPQYSKR